MVSSLISITARCHLVLSVSLCVTCTITCHCISAYIRSGGYFWIMAKFGWQIVLLTGRGEILVVSWLHLIGNWCY